MKTLCAAILYLILLPAVLFAQQSSHPKFEFRGAWIATVINLDWPSNPGLSTATQKQELISLLDELHAAGINAVMFQIRSECDAMYDSPYEPWSFWLTGKQGKAPEPYYDPLQFAIEEAHKRGMELHAWFNPYRASREIGNYTLAGNHVIQQHPEWILTFNKVNLKTLNPGMQAVRDYLIQIIMDIVRRYDVDGIHYDDYFYPYPNARKNFPGITTEDNATFQRESRGFSEKPDWRRDNINLFVKSLGDSIRTAKPWVSYGVSPFGIWKNGVPAGISGMNAFSEIYADAKTWLESAYVDYLAPQLYWPHGGSQDYGKLLQWWSTSASLGQRHLYPGIALYRQSGWPSYEIKNQIRENRATPDVLGSILFRAQYVGENIKGFTDELRSNLYRDPAITPPMDWKISDQPEPPQNARFDLVAGTNSWGLNWQAPVAASAGDSARFYAIYQFRQPSISTADLEQAVNLIDISSEQFNIQSIEAEGIGPLYYVITAINRYSRESLMSDIIRVDAPDAPRLIAPAIAAIVGEPDQTLRWHNPGSVASYHLTVAKDAEFYDRIYDEGGITDTAATLSGLQGLSSYFWQVKASNAGGGSAASVSGRFDTGFPKAPVLAWPTNHLRQLETDLALVWFAADSANSYQLQVSTARTFDSTEIIIDETGLSDTTFALANLLSAKLHYWRVRAENNYGTGNWSPVFRFRTRLPSAIAESKNLPEVYKLWQNYPNPFNPTTVIAYDLRKPGFVQLIVYDLLGREVTTLVAEVRSAGHHVVTFNGRRLSSGIYIYRLMVNGILRSKRMLLVK